MTRPIQLVFLVAGFALAAVAPSISAEFESLKTNYSKSADAASLAEFQRYHGALAKLETSLVGGKDYAAAIHVQRERLRVAAKIEQLGALQPRRPGSSDSSSSSSIELDLASASTGSGVVHDAASGTLVGWSTPGAYAEWTLPDHPAGGYAVELTYSTTSAPGKIVLSESFYTLTRETAPTGGKATFATNTLGTIRLKAGSGPFRITAGTFPGAELFTLKAVRITSQKP